MFRFLVRYLQSRPIARPAIRRLGGWRDSLAFYWSGRDGGSLGFVLAVTAFVSMLGGIVYFAYTDHSRMAAERKRHADLTCLATNIYHEARGEPPAGQRAVAEVTLNRVASPDFPQTVCDVVYERHWDRRRSRYVGAFSWTEFDAIGRPKGDAWRDAVAAARAVYDSESERVLENALFYHADYVEPPWATTRTRITTIGRHVFYE